MRTCPARRSLAALFLSLRMACPAMPAGLYHLGTGGGQKRTAQGGQAYSFRKGRLASILEQRRIVNEAITSSKQRLGEQLAILYSNDLSSVAPKTSPGSLLTPKRPGCSTTPTSCSRNLQNRNREGAAYRCVLP